MTLLTANTIQMILIQAHSNRYHVDLDTAAVEWIGKHAEEFRMMLEYCNE